MAIAAGKFGWLLPYSRHYGNLTRKMQVEPMLLATGDWLYARVDNILGESENVNVIQRSYGGTQRRSYQVARFREGLSYPLLERLF